MKEKLKTNNSIRDCLAFVDIKYLSVLKIEILQSLVNLRSIS